ncbi:hypothetical protein VTN02DRAFT_5041 [Thermoascus thermophilus]
MATLGLPAGFLPPPAPKGAAMRRIDFTKTNPPIPEYKDYFAVMIDGVLSESECAELIRAAEASIITPESPNNPTWPRATIDDVISIENRNCGRISFDTPLLAQKILDRLTPFLTEAGIDTIHNQPLITGMGAKRRGEVFHLSRLNERLRFLKYEGGEYFRPHCDSAYETANGHEVSLFTIHLYLNGDGEQDPEELAQAQKRAEEEKSQEEESTTAADPSGKLLGGATSFMVGFDEAAVRIFPKTGSALVFQQNNMFHAGDDVYRGVKYTMRTEIMYRKSNRI